MKRFANALALTLKGMGLQGALMRLAVLLLPWQTRYFVEGPTAGGFAWEQGRWSLYASMLVMGAVVAYAAARSRSLSLIVARRVPRSSTERPEATPPATDRADHGGMGQVGVTMAMLLGFAYLAFPTLSLTATFQGLGQVALLAAFVWIAYRDEAFRSNASFWLVLSLLPVALFALGQTVFQWVPALKWLGVAVHDPLVRGTSVIETGSGRFLRAYGSFPHPNILGGWMAFGVLQSLRGWMAREGRRWIYLVTTALFAVALYASFSRSAWIACAIGICVFACAVWKSRGLKRIALAAGLIAIVLGGMVALKPELVRTRIASQQRLEVKSFNERTASVAQAWDVVRTYPFGTGFEAYRVGLERVCFKKGCLVPAEPPHLVPLLALAELGWLRCALALCVFAWLSWRARAWVRKRGLLLVPLTIIAAFDHYLWSLWAGQALIAMALLVDGGGSVDNGASGRHDRGTEE